MSDILRPHQVTGAVMFHIGRCGSTVLAEMFARQAATRSLGEVYTTYRTQKIKDQGLTAADYTVFRLRKAARNLAKEAAPYPRALMFEVKFLSSLDLRLLSGDLPAYLAFLTDLGVTQAVILSRRNLLKRLISTRLALAREDYYLLDGSKIELPRVELPVSGLYMGMRGSLVEVFDKITAEYQALALACKAAGLATLHLVYEDDIQSDPNLALSRLCDSLGRPADPVVPKYQRINTRTLPEILINHDEVAAHLTGTAYEWMLTDG